MAIQEIPEGGYAIDPQTGMPYDPNTGEYVADDRQISSSPEDRSEPEEADDGDDSVEAEIQRRVNAALAAQAAAAQQPSEPAKRGPGRPRKDAAPQQKTPPDIVNEQAEASEREALAEAAARKADQQAAREAEIARRVDAATARGAGAAQAASKPQAVVPLSQQAAAQGRASVPAQARSTALAAPAGDLLDLYVQDAAKGLDFTAEDMAIPRLYLLQDMSPQVKERDPDYVQGARPGMWLNTVTRALYPTFNLIPIKYTRRYVGWRPRREDGSGGGLVRMDVPREEYLGYEQRGIGVRVYMDEEGLVEVVETPEWIGYLVGAGQDMSVALSFPKTKASAAGNINTLLTLQKVVAADGREVELPCYANILTIGSKVAGEGKITYFVPNATLAGRVDDRALYLKLRRLRDNFDRGDAEIIGDLQQ